MYIGENTEYNWIFDNMNFGGFRISSRVSIQTEVIIDRTHAGELWGGLIVDIRDNRSLLSHQHIHQRRLSCIGLSQDYGFHTLGQHPSIIKGMNRL